MTQLLEGPGELAPFAASLQRGVAASRHHFPPQPRPKLCGGVVAVMEAEEDKRTVFCEASSGNSGIFCTEICHGIRLYQSFCYIEKTD